MWTRSCKCRNSGHSIVDALVFLVLVSLFLGAIAIARTQADEQAQRIACASNLRQIGMAMRLYANENKGWYPRTVFEVNSADAVNQFTNWRAREPFGTDGPKPNDVTASAYLLLRTQNIQPSVFHCPSSFAKPLRFGFSATSQRAIPGQSGTADPISAEAQKQIAEQKRNTQPLPENGDPSVEPVAEDPHQISNFPGPEYMSYSFANPYPGTRGQGSGFKLNYNLTGDFVLAADVNPGGDGPVTADIDKMPPPEMPEGKYKPFAKTPWKFTNEQRAANSPNHQGFGQNVLFCTGSVAWEPTPFVGAAHKGAQKRSDRRDNIYTRYLEGVDPAKRGDPIVGPPMDENDSVLLPTAAPGSTPATKATQSAPSTDPVEPSAPEPKPVPRQAGDPSGIHSPTRK